MAEFQEGDGLQRELGISRRELMKRGAIVGGTLLWAAPIVQTLGPAARAQARPSVCGCCYCFDATNARNDICDVDGVILQRSDPRACAAFCTTQLAANFNTTPANVRSDHCQGRAGECSCSLNPGGSPPFGCDCTA